MTWVLIALNCVVFYYEIVAPDPQAFIEQWAMYPRRFDYAVSPEALATTVTSAFLHGGLLHLLTNLVYLFVFGGRVEQRLGPPLFLVLYLAGAVAAGLTHALANPLSEVPMVGASGAVSAVLGAYTVYHPFARLQIIVPMVLFFFRVWVPALVFIVLWIVTQVSGVFSPGEGVAWWAHLGGFGFGCFAGMMLRDFRQPVAPPETAK